MEHLSLSTFLRIATNPVNVSLTVPPFACFVKTVVGG